MSITLILSQVFLLMLFCIFCDRQIQVGKKCFWMPINLIIDYVFILRLFVILYPQYIYIQIQVVITHFKR